MNCKPGDMAIVVNGFPGKNIGKVVTCISTITHNYITLWIYEGDVEGLSGFRALAIDDASLRPLRDSDGADETLTWKDVPSEVTA